MGSSAGIPPGKNYHPKNLIELLRERASLDPDREAFWVLDQGINPGNKITYKELDQQARAIGSTLQDLGQLGKRVLLLYPPGLEIISAFFGCFYAGCVAVPLFPPDPTRLEQTLPRLLATIKDAESSIVLTTSQILLMSEALFQIEPNLKKMIWKATDNIEVSQGEKWKKLSTKPESVALLLYTSGSTGEPKGVILNHANPIHYLDTVIPLHDQQSYEFAVLWAPPYHISGILTAILTPIYCGVTMALMSPLDFLKNPINWLKAISKFKATRSGSPPFGYDLCVTQSSPDDRKGLDLSMWSTALIGSETIHPKTIDDFVKTFEPYGFKREAFCPAYGLTETSFLVSEVPHGKKPIVLNLDPDCLLKGQIKKITTQTKNGQQIVGCGQILQDYKVRIVNPETLGECEKNQIGEIWVSGKNISSGYWKRTKINKITFKVEISNTKEGPFFRTGDLGFLDSGEIFITGRLKELIIIRGINYYPDDIEFTVKESHPFLSSSAIAAFSITKNRQENLVLVVEVKSKTKSENNQIIDSIRESVTLKHNLQVFAIKLVAEDSLPRTVTRKIQRKGCRDHFLNNNLKIVDEWQQEESQAIGKSLTPAEIQYPIANNKGNLDKNREVISDWLVNSIADVLKINPNRISIDQPFFRFGLDSASTVRLAGALEKWLGSNLDPTLFWEYPTIDELSNYLAGSKSDSSFQKRKDISLAQPEHLGKREAIAIVGMSCRFPGAKDLESFWKLLIEGRDAIEKVPSDRYDVDQFFSKNNAKSGKLTTRWGGFLKNIDQFDSEFFNLSPREAATMDPQQRLLLEVSWEAIEDAGIVPGGPQWSSTGVFIGISNNEYAKFQFSSLNAIDAFAALGNSHSISANRISYIFDFHGPSMAIDTACSSSLVAVDMACKSLWNRDCSSALVGGVNVILGPELAISFSKAGAMALDGRCKAFDEKADGWVRSEGAGAVFLKPLSKAIEENDPIYAVILGSSVNSDGKSNGLFAPNPQAQKSVLWESYENAGISPGKVQYVEAHGTGTTLGDPIEARSLGEVVSFNRPPGRECSIGSVKSNFGHLESAAGIAGLIKTVLAINKGTLPKSIHFKKPNPRIPFRDLNLKVQSATEPWSKIEGEVRLAGVSSFGFGGTNCHVVVQEYKKETPQQVFENKAPTQLPILISAKTKQALKDKAKSINEYLKDKNHEFSNYDLAYTLSLRRTHWNHRLAFVSDSKEKTIENLNLFLKEETFHGLSSGVINQNKKNKMAFVFSGHGPKWASVKNLFENNQIFQNSILECNNILKGLCDWSLKDLIVQENLELDLNRSDIIQPTLFSVQIALAELWRSWGVIPSAVVGHSMGEVAAAYVSGSLELEDALRVIAQRGKIVQKAAGKGEMLAAEISEEKIKSIIDPLIPEVSLAAVNSSNSVVLSGDSDSLKNVHESLKQKNIFSKKLQVNFAFHSQQMDPIKEEFIREIQGIQAKNGKIPFYSTVEGKEIPGGQLTEEYWGRNLRQMVNFEKTLKELIKLDHQTFIEINLHPSLGIAIQKAGEDLKKEVIFCPSLMRGEPEEKVLKNSLGKLYCRGVPLVLRNVFPKQGKVLRLPNYPWQKERHWLDIEMSLGENTKINRGKSPNKNLGENNSLLGNQLELAGNTGTKYWEANLHENNISDLAKYKINGNIVLPITSLIEMALSGHPYVNRQVKWVIKNFKIVKALSIPRGKRITTQFVLSPEDGKKYHFEIFSKVIDDGSNNKKWSLISSGYLTSKEKNKMKENEPSLAEVQKRISKKLTNKEIIKNLKDSGLDFDWLYPGSESVWVSKNEALCRTKIPEPPSGTAKSFKIPPELLNSILYCGVAILNLKGQGIKKNKQLVPLGIDQFEKMSDPKSILWCYARFGGVDAEGKIYKYSFWIYNENGNLIAKIKNFKLRSIKISKNGVQQKDASSKGIDFELINKIKSSTPNQANHIIESFITKEIRKVLGLSSKATIDRKKGLMEMGMDSLLAIEFANRLNSKTGQSLPATLALESPNIESISEFLTRKLLVLEISKKSKVDQKQRNAAREIKKQISSLSEKETKETLLQELERIGY